MEPAAPEPELITSVRMPAGHKQYDVLTYARLADAVALTEGVDLTEVQQLAANYLSINPNEHGIIVTLSKRAMDRQPESLQEMAGTMQGISMRARQAKDIDALFDGFSKSVGGAGTALDITHFRGTFSYLRTDNDTEFGPAPMPLLSGLHPEGISDLVLDLTDAGTRTGGVESGLSTELIQQWWRGSDRAYGVQVFDLPYLTRDGSDDYKGTVMSQEALVMVLEAEDDKPTQVDIGADRGERGVYKVAAQAHIELDDPEASIFKHRHVSSAWYSVWMVSSVTVSTLGPANTMPWFCRWQAVAPPSVRTTSSACSVLRMRIPELAEVGV